MAAAATRRQAKQALLDARIVFSAVAAAMHRDNAKILEKLQSELLKTM